MLALLNVREGAEKCRSVIFTDENMFFLEL